MTECLSYKQQGNFAAVVASINQELQEKGYLTDADEQKMVDKSNPASKSAKGGQPRHLNTEMRAQNFDVIRFATYRTACKLRFIQKKTQLHLVDIWNVIESFRENGLNTLQPVTELNVTRLEAILTSIFHQLNKRLPAAQQITVNESISLLVSWLLGAYDRENKGRIKVFSLKIALAHMCAGKLMDKLRYIFTQISDSSGYMVRDKFEDYLYDILALPTAVFEGPSFGYNETAARSCFDGRSRVNVNDFLNVLLSDPGPQCIMWLPILYRMSQVENVFHPVQCEGCHRESFMGFRYKCQRCYSYQLCQDCFWRGRTSGNHSNDHEMKEYTSYKSPAKQIGHALKKQLRCIPGKTNHRIPQFPDAPEKTLDLSHIVPPTPVPLHNGFPETSVSQSIDLSSVDSSSASRSPSKLNASVDSNRVDDEHRLIARYAARLAADTNNAARSPTELNFSLDSSKSQRDLIGQLETKNREIMREIQRLRLEQEAHAKSSLDAEYNPTLLAELRLLRQRKDELESRMQALQESRKELMVQLEELMILLKNHGSPRSTPNSSPHSRSGHSPTMLANKGSGASTPMESLSGLGGDVKQAFSQCPPVKSHVRNQTTDLLIAADSVTNAMSSLVKELNSEGSGSDEDNEDKYVGGSYDSDYFHMISTDEAWQDELQRRLGQESEFISQLRARRQLSNSSSRNPSDTEQESYIPTDDAESYVRTDDESIQLTDGESYVRTDDEDAELYDRHPKELVHRYATDEESFQQTDDESYIRTDDEEGGSTEWEESMKRWVNR